MCDSSDTREIAGPEEIRDEVEALWDFHTARLKPETPPEKLVDRVAFSQAPPVRVVQCTACGLVYRNPRERERELRGVYAGEVPEQRVLQSLHDIQRESYRAQATRLGEVARRAGSGLEVGSYVGAFLAASRDTGWRFEGVDVNEVANTFTRSLGFHVTPGDIAAMVAEADGRTFDAVAIWNCFDQLADPRATARAARTLLRNGGVLAVRVPNGGFYAALRGGLDGVSAPVARALLAHNNLLTFPYRNGFTPPALERVLEEAGFRVVRTEGDALVPIADEWTLGWAALEEKIVKWAVKRGAAATGADGAAWFEMYAEARSDQ
ncbi:MAG: class I SAM-dependent methyltransferase [Gemmatimonadota bacterium]|nr:class I SAM-dependent methyltransferase [Gemmatimonadota bacterium]